MCLCVSDLLTPSPAGRGGELGTSDLWPPTNTRSDTGSKGAAEMRGGPGGRQTPYSTVTFLVGQPQHQAPCAEHLLHPAPRRPGQGEERETGELAQGPCQLPEAPIWVPTCPSSQGHCCSWRSGLGAGPGTDEQGWAQRPTAGAAWDGGQALKSKQPFPGSCPTSRGTGQVASVNPTSWGTGQVASLPRLDLLQPVTASPGAP